VRGVLPRPSKAWTKYFNAPPGKVLKILCNLNLS
jgi:hypothetical protein